MRTSPALISFLLVFALTGAGCTLFRPAEPPPSASPLTPPVTEPMLIDDGTSTEADADMIDSTSTSETPTVLATYVPFDRRSYDLALQANVPIMLFFYANWCPTCKVQEPQNVEAFKDLSLATRGFRINFNDNQTDGEEKEIAKAFGVTYQHTFIFLDNNGKEITRKVGPMPPEELRALLKEIANR